MDKRIYKNGGESVSLLGFGLMRLPLNSENKGDINKAEAQKLVDYAYAHGVNYFDTGYGYHERACEPFAGEALAKYPRESYYLAAKMPTWDLVQTPEDVDRIFAEQLKNMRTDYFDFYLAHNISGKNYDNLKKNNIYEKLKKYKEEGKIRHLGFSFHDTPAMLRDVLDNYEWDFAQIQLNYVDWVSCDAKTQYEMLTEKGLPVVVMEPVRGGALAMLNEEASGYLKAENPDASAVSWALRYAASLPNVFCVLSGMGNLPQVQENIETMSNLVPLSPAEYAAIDKAATAYLASGTIPCSGCRYCMDCPAGVDIPRVFSSYNYYRLTENIYSFLNTYATLTDGERANSCIACGACLPKCPQGIDIPAEMQTIAAFAAEQNM